MICYNRLQMFIHITAPLRRTRIWRKSICIVFSAIDSVIRTADNIESDEMMTICNVCAGSRTLREWWIATHTASLHSWDSIKLEFRAQNGRQRGGRALCFYCSHFIICGKSAFPSSTWERERESAISLIEQFVLCYRGMGGCGWQ